MRLSLFVTAAALLLAGVAAEDALQTHANTTDPAITACSNAGGPAQGDCTPYSLGSPPSLVLSHTVLERGCAGGSLHVMHYESAGRSAPLVATWCR